MKFNDTWMRVGMRTNFGPVRRQGLSKIFCRQRMSHPPHVWRGKQFLLAPFENLYCGGRRFDAT